MKLAAPTKTRSKEFQLLYFQLYIDCVLLYSVAHSFILDLEDIKYRQLIPNNNLNYVASHNLANIPVTSPTITVAIEEIRTKVKQQDIYTHY